jgi:hypothetical protein
MKELTSVWHFFPEGLGALVVVLVAPVDVLQHVQQAQLTTAAGVALTSCLCAWALFVALRRRRPALVAMSIVATLLVALGERSLVH